MSYLSAFKIWAVFLLHHVQIIKNMLLCEKFTFCACKSAMAVSAYLEKSLVNEQVTVDIIRNCGLVVNNSRQRPNLVTT